MKFTKIVGWILLSIGIAIIFYSLYSSYTIFTGSASVPEIFKTDHNLSLQQPALPETGAEFPIDSEREAMEEMIEEQLRGVLPVDSISKLLNLITWSIFAGILIFGGTQISGLGIKLIKK